MEPYYKSFKCLKCKREFILITDEYNCSLKEGRYINCPHCGSKKIINEKSTEDLKECMTKERVYYRGNHGAIRQR